MLLLVHHPAQQKNQCKLAGWRSLKPLGCTQLNCRKAEMELQGLLSPGVAAEEIIRPTAEIIRPTSGWSFCFEAAWRISSPTWVCINHADPAKDFLHKAPCELCDVLKVKLMALCVNPTLYNRNIPNFSYPPTILFAKSWYLVCPQQNLSLLQ